MTANGCHPQRVMFSSTNWINSMFTLAITENH